MVKTEQNGAKNGGGYWGKRAEAKRISNTIRRAEEKRIVTLASEPSLMKYFNFNREFVKTNARAEFWRLEKEAEKMLEGLAQ